MEKSGWDLRRWRYSVKSADRLLSHELSSPDVSGRAGATGAGVTLGQAFAPSEVRIDFPLERASAAALRFLYD